MIQKLNGVILDYATLGEISLPEELHQKVNWEIFSETSKNELSERLVGADIVLTNKVILGEEELSGTPVKYIGVLATGVNNIDLNYCADHNIEVKNAVGYSTDSVAQHTFAMLFSAIVNISKQDEFVKNDYGSSRIFTNFNHEFFEIKNKTWAIIGLGNIGKKVAEIAHCFGANVVHYSTSGISRSEKFPLNDLQQIADSADIISIHSPFNDKTENLINYDFLTSLKKKPYLLNLGRGGIVNEDDLIIALNEDKLTMACLDVFEKEPFEFSEKYSALTDKNKILCTPHIAWASKEARTELLAITQQNLLDWINNK